MTTLGLDCGIEDDGAGVIKRGECGSWEEAALKTETRGISFKVGVSVWGENGVQTKDPKKDMWSRNHGRRTEKNTGGLGDATTIMRHVPHCT